MLRWFLTRVLVIALPIIELLLIVWVGNTIGWWWTLGLLAAGVVIGFLIMRAAGRDAFRAVTAPMQRHQPYVEIDETTGVAQTVHPNSQPSREEVEQASAELGQSGLLFVSGMLIAIPGFITDVLGALLLVPVSRRLVSPRMPRRTARTTVIIRGETLDGDSAPPTPGPYDPSRGQDRSAVIRGEILPPQRPNE